MTTIRQIITDALRESGIIGVNVTPSAAIQGEGLRRLQNIIKSLYGNELGEPLVTVDYEDVKADEFLPVNVRIIFNDEGAQTLDMFDNPDDGARFAVFDNGASFATENVTLLGNGRKIEGADSLVLNTNSLNREWLYRGDTGNWVRVTDLTVDDESPFPSEFDDLLVTMLAIRTNARHGAETAVDTVETYRRMLRQFRARYRQDTQKPSEAGLLYLTSNPQHQYRIDFE